MMMLIPKTWKCFTPRINGKLSVQVRPFLRGRTYD